MGLSERGLLLDLDGVFYVGDRLLPGATETLAWLRERQIPFRFLTNTTTKAPSALRDKLAKFGLEAEPDDVFTAVDATISRLEEAGTPKIFPLVHDAVRPLLERFPEDSEAPDFVVVGDIGAQWDYPLLNQAFRLLMNGAELLCMHRNKFWEDADGLRMDIGAFVAALEYVSGKEAITVGKPSKAFFTSAAAKLGVEPEKVLMVGDDLDADIGGAQNAGFGGVLVRTGKFRPETLERSEIEPNAVIDSIADLPEFLTDS